MSPSWAVERQKEIDARHASHEGRDGNGCEHCVVSRREIVRARCHRHWKRDPRRDIVLVDYLPSRVRTPLKAVCYDSWRCCPLDLLPFLVGIVCGSGRRRGRIRTHATCWIHVPLVSEVPTRHVCDTVHFSCRRRQKALENLRTAARRRNREEDARRRRKKQNKWQPYITAYPHGFAYCEQPGHDHEQRAALPALEFCNRSR